MDYHISDVMKSQGINLSKEQFIVLKHLHDQDGRKQNDLAFITNRSKTALTRLIHTMEKKGFVTRSVSQEDLRINNVFITEKGKTVWESSLPHFMTVIKELQKDISEEDLIVAQKVLKKIQENIKIKTTIK